jgi:hypothetical protein
VGTCLHKGMTRRHGIAVVARASRLLSDPLIVELVELYVKMFMTAGVGSGRGNAEAETYSLQSRSAA